MRLAIPSMEMLAITLRMRMVPVDKWGKRDAQGRYDGLLGMLQRGEVHLAVSSLVPQPQHLDAATFIGPAWSVSEAKGEVWGRTLAMVRQPSRAGDVDALVQPLTSPAWLCCGLLLAALVAGLRATTWAHRRFVQPVCPPQRQPLEDSWSDSLLLVVGAISEQGTANDSSQPSWRLVVLLTFMLSLLMNTYYSASMTVTLLLPPPVIYRSLADMVRGDVRLALHNTPDMLQLLQDPLLQQLRRADRLSLSPLQDAMDRARADSSRVAAAANAAVLYAALSPSDRCALSEVPLFPPHHSLLPLAKGSPLKELLSVGLRRCWERGVSRRLEGVYLPRAPECVAVARPGGVRLTGVLPAIALLLLGTALAVLLLVAEMRVLRACYSLQYALNPLSQFPLNRLLAPSDTTAATGLKFI
ncbi:glutamate receptor ionotropic, kainate glr-3-like [Schistocerca cancellata]|uniref:glutamate receptor ionotropic, kainate glr-3-like n=1 Tax=Schistocerca cancellata TaxID=274614 RepID=UPI002119B66F|nr:glutamate receptor ionotropic, kainate glr-3-like [Schistocerca cancellata]